MQGLFFRFDHCDTVALTPTAGQNPVLIGLGMLAIILVATETMATSSVLLTLVGSGHLRRNITFFLTNIRLPDQALIYFW